jgi:imidazoleglycerol-phosphate dehydratase
VNEAPTRTAQLSRETSESSIELSLNLDGTGVSDISTSVPFFDHMLTAFAKHSLIDLTVRATGDVEIDVHHTVEDIGIVLGKAINKALGDKAGISRYGDALVTLDEALVQAGVLTWCTRESRPVSNSTSSGGTSPAPWFATSSRRSLSMRESPCT